MHTEDNLYGFYKRNLRLTHDNPIKYENYQQVPLSKKGRVKRLWNWRPENDTLGMQLFREWSIHGIKYIAQPNRHVFERFFWLLTVLSSTGVAVYLSYQVVKKYYESPVIVSFQSEQTSVSQVPFPAITICNVNLFKKSEFEIVLGIAKKGPSEPHFQGAVNILREMDHVCETSKSFSTKLNFSLDETTVNLNERHLNIEKYYENKSFTVAETFENKNRFKPSITRCQEMIPLCTFEGEIFPCHKEFIPILTDFGICCTFNMMPRRLLLNLSVNDVTLNDEEKNISQSTLDEWNAFNLDKHLIKTTTNEVPPYPRHQAKAGKPSGLSVLLFPNINEYFCTVQDGYGFRIFAHSPIELPHVLQFGMAVSPNIEMFVNLQAEVTVSESDIDDLDPDTRACYFLRENPLKLFAKYTAVNCVDECITLRTEEKCGCILYDMPQTSANATYCEGKRFQCAMREKDEIGKLGTKFACKKCFPACNRIVYDARTSLQPLRNDLNIWMHEMTKGSSVSEGDQQEMIDWMDKNVSIVHLYFGSDTVYTRVRKRLYNFNELFANVGGILGLFIGFSLISLVEPFYFIYRILLNKKENNEDDIDE